MSKWLPPGRGGYHGGVVEESGPGRKWLRLVNQLAEAERERDHWEAEHAALFHAVAGDGAAVRFARAFGGYDDLEWARLDPYERQWLTDKGQRVVDMIVDLTS